MMHVELYYLAIAFIAAIALLIKFGTTMIKAGLNQHSIEFTTKLNRLKLELDEVQKSELLQEKRYQSVLKRETNFLTELQEKIEYDRNIILKLHAKELESFKIQCKEKYITSWGKAQLFEIKDHIITSLLEQIKNREILNNTMEKK